MVQGWEQWARDIEDIIASCESEAAIDLVQERNRELLKSLSRERQDLYRELGEAVVARREAFQQRSDGGDRPSGSSQSPRAKDEARRRRQAASRSSQPKHGTATSRAAEPVKEDA